MKSIKEYSQEMYDIRNRMLTEAHTAKYYTVKQSIALLKKNLEEIENAYCQNRERSPVCPEPSYQIPLRADVYRG